MSSSAVFHVLQHHDVEVAEPAGKKHRRNLSSKLWAHQLLTVLRPRAWSSASPEKRRQRPSAVPQSPTTPYHSKVSETHTPSSSSSTLSSPVDSAPTAFAERDSAISSPRPPSPSETDFAYDQDIEQRPEHATTIPSIHRFKGGTRFIEAL